MILIQINAPPNRTTLPRSNIYSHKLNDIKRDKCPVTPVHIPTTLVKTPQLRSKFFTERRGNVIITRKSITLTFSLRLY